MRVIRAKTAGFCMGVHLAIRILDGALAARPAGQKLYTLGPIIHNPALVAEYEKKGVRCLDDYRAAEPGSAVVIRAHGLPRDTENALAGRALTVVDATCPKVKAAQLAIKQASDSNLGAMLLFGEKDHPEVRSLLSYARDDAIVFNSFEELAAAPPNPEKAYFMAAQTTQDQAVFSRSALWLSERLGKNLSVLHTICHATAKRQAEVIALTGQVKSMVIVGGMNSGNTRRLAEISRSRGIFTAHCEDGSELLLDKLERLQPVGLSAGASTPDEQINAIESILINF